MAADIDKLAIIEALVVSAKSIKEAAKLGQSLANKIDKVYLVGCGAPNRIMLGLEYWLQHYSPSLEVRRYFPAEFITHTFQIWDAVVLAASAEAGADVLLSEDMQHGFVWSGVTVLNPFVLTPEQRAALAAG